LGKRKRKSLTEIRRIPCKRKRVAWVLNLRAENKQKTLLSSWVGIPSSATRRKRAEPDQNRKRGAEGRGEKADEWTNGGFKGIWGLRGRQKFPAAGQRPLDKAKDEGDIVVRPRRLKRGLLREPGSYDSRGKEKQKLLGG